MSTPRTLLSVLAGALLVVAGCTSGAPAATPTPTAEPATPVAQPPTATPAAPTPTPVPPTATPQSPTVTAEPATPSASPGEALALEGRIENVEHGYAVTLPEGWLRIDADEEFMDALAEELSGEQYAEVNETFGDQLQALIEAGVTLFAFRQSELGGDFPTNANVISLPTMGMSLDALETLNVSQLSQLPGVTSEVETERVELRSGEALHLTYTMERPTPAGEPLDVRIHQYLIQTDGEDHMLTVSGLEGDENLANEAREMAASFEVLEGD